MTCVELLLVPLSIARGVSQPGGPLKEHGCGLRLRWQRSRLHSLLVEAKGLPRIFSADSQEGGVSIVASLTLQSQRAGALTKCCAQGAAHNI